MVRINRDGAAAGGRVCARLWRRIDVQHRMQVRILGASELGGAIEEEAVAPYEIARRLPARSYQNGSWDRATLSNGDALLGSGATPLPVKGAVELCRNAIVRTGFPGDAAVVVV